MDGIFERTEQILGKDGLSALQKATVAVVGLGGVGSFAAMALARSGVGHLILVDYDTADPSNMNRQLPARADTLGRYKTEVLKEDFASAAPDCRVDMITAFATEENLGEIFAQPVDYIVDAIDSIGSKISLLLYAWDHHIPIVSAMGAGNKLDPSRLKISDIFKTEVCPLAKIIRTRMKKAGVKKLTVAWSDELPTESEPGIIGSMVFVPGAMGLLLASRVTKALCGLCPTDYMK